MWSWLARNKQSKHPTFEPSVSLAKADQAPPAGSRENAIDMFWIENMAVALLAWYTVNTE